MAFRDRLQNWAAVAGIVGVALAAAGLFIEGRDIEPQICRVFLKSDSGQTRPGLHVVGPTGDAVTSDNRGIAPTPCSWVAKTVSIRDGSWNEIKTATLPGSDNEMPTLTVPAE